MRHTDHSNIPQILDAIHDRWFKSNEISFDRITKTLTIPYEDVSLNNIRVLADLLLFRVVKKSITKHLLLIHAVQDYTVKDEALTNIYDFNDLIYDTARKELTLTSGLPYKLKCEVASFDVEIRETGIILNTKTAIANSWGDK